VVKVLTETDHDDIHEQLKADSRGRVNLGTEYAGKTVSVAVLEVEEE
jgi:hypothetical protein